MNIIQNLILNCKVSLETENDWNYTTAVESRFIDETIPIPEKIDLRDDTWWTINNQQNSSSCVAWAVADSCLRWHFVENGYLNTNELLSPRFIWMASKETDEIIKRPTSFIESSGTSIKAALDVARVYGCVTEEVLPFYGNSLFTKDERLFYSNASKFKILNYFNLKFSNDNDKIVETDVEKWKIWLANGNGPIIVRFNIDRTWNNVTFENPNLEEYANDPSVLGHAVTIVGFIDNRFIIRNSEGTGWGKNGYAFASLPYAKKAFTEVYGVCVGFKKTCSIAVKKT